MLRKNRILPFRAIVSIAVVILVLFKPELSSGNYSTVKPEEIPPAGSGGDAGIITGRVTECQSGQPVKLATVMVLQTGSTALSGGDGTFRLEVPSRLSRVHLSITHVSYASVPAMEVETAAGEEIEVCLSYQVYRSSAIRVTAEIPEKQPVVFDRVEMDPLDISRGALSQTDPLHALKSLPQVSSGTDFDGRFSIRGSSPDANAFFYDGLLFPSPYHLGGLCSIYDVSNIREFSFSNTPVSASAYGATGAVVEVETKDGTQMTEGNSFSLGLLSSSVSTQRFLRDKTTFFSLMARRSYMDILYEMFRRDDKNTRIPNFHDIQASVVQSLDEKDYIKAGVLLSGDQTRMDTGGMVEQEDDRPAIIDWKRKLEAFSLMYGRRRSKSSPYWGRMVLAWQPFRSEFSIGGSEDERMMWRGGRGIFRLDLNRKYRQGVFSGGVLASISDIRHDLNFGRGFWLASRYQNSAVRLDNDGWVFHSRGRRQWFYSGIYGEMTWAGDDTGLRAGIRGEYFGRSDETVATPRLSIYQNLGERSRLMLTCGYFVRDPAEDFGNPTVIGEDISTEKAARVSVGFGHRFVDDLSAQVSIFAGREWDLPVEVEPTLYRSGGKCRNGGMELGFKKSMGSVTATATYAFTHARRLDLPHTLSMDPLVSDGEVTSLKAGKDDPYWYNSPYHSRHSVSLEAEKRMGENFFLSVSWQLKSGRSYTPIERVYQRKVGGYVASEGEKMSERLPHFSRIDLHAEWRGESRVVFLEVLNLTNRDNPFNLRYNMDYTEKTYYKMLPVTPAFGMRFMF